MRRKEQKEQTKQLLFDSAIELFKKQGFQNTTVQQISNHAGVAKGTFFNYFTSKEAALYAIGSHQIALLKDFKSEYKFCSSIEAAFKGLFSKMAAVNEEYGPNLLLSIFHIMTVQKDFQQTELKMSCFLKEFLASMIKDGQESKEFSSSIEAEPFAQMIVNSYFGTLFHWVHHYEQESLEELMASMASLYLFGLKSGLHQHGC
jgi:AcrR family transcriptional regulator